MPSLNPVFQKLASEASRRCLLMGVLNVTPDSFSDGGLYSDPEKALARAEEMLSQGADLIDVGAESTRPGAEPVSEEEELRRLRPLLQSLAKKPGLPWSIDTSKAKVAELALDSGACMVNDVSALRQDPAMPSLAAKRGCGVVLMHRLGEPKGSSWSSSEAAGYGESGVLPAVRKFLANRASDLLLQGLSKAQFWIDPGFGFGKSVQDNLALLKGLQEFTATGYPVLLGTSRKSSLGAVLGGLPESERLEGTAATVALAAWLGASCVRVHDVLEMGRVLKTVQAVKSAPGKAQAQPEGPRPIHPFRSSEEF